MAEEQAPIPIVEHLPNGDRPHPTIDESAPAGTLGHPDEHLEHEPIEHEGSVIAGPPGHDVVIEMTPSEAQVEAELKEKLKEPAETGDRWLGGMLKRKKSQNHAEQNAE